MKILLIAAFALTACAQPSADVSCWTPGADTEQFAASLPRCATPVATSTISPVGNYYLDLIATASDDPSVPVGGHASDRFSVSGNEGSLVIVGTDAYSEVKSIEETYSSPTFTSVVTALNPGGQSEVTTRDLTLTTNVTTCGGSLVTGTETYTYQVLTHAGVITYTTSWMLYSDCSTLEVGNADGLPLTSDEDDVFSDPENVAAMEAP
jgi:hypothetical protein